jgi:predicted N-acetyltransferase YhbS
MTASSITVRLERPSDEPTIESLYADLFGPERFRRAAYVLREGVSHDRALSFVVCQSDDEPMASVRMTPITLGGRPALILGPLVVSPVMKGRGAGRALVRLVLAHAWVQGHKLVMLVGDLPYYAPMGFVNLGRDVITLPAPVDPDRVLVAGLCESALDGLAGAAQPVKTHI